MAHTKVGKKVLTLLFVTRNDDKEVLLGLKKRGFGVGKWNGFGGKVEPNETIIQGAIRETMEECSVRPLNAEQRGILHFKFVDDPVLFEVHVFRATEWEGDVAESEEMRPQWFGVDKVPFDSMWKDDAHWFPLLFAGSTFAGWARFRGQTDMLEHDFFAVKGSAEMLSLVDIESAEHYQRLIHGDDADESCVGK